MRERRCHDFYYVAQYGLFFLSVILLFIAVGSGMYPAFFDAFFNVPNLKDKDEIKTFWRMFWILFAMIAVRFIQVLYMAGFSVAIVKYFHIYREANSNHDEFEAMRQRLLV